VPTAQERFDSVDGSTLHWADQICNKSCGKLEIGANPAGMNVFPKMSMGKAQLP